MKSTSSTAASWLGRHPALTKLVLVGVSSTFTLLLGECTLRLLGLESGYVPRYKRFRPVDQLEVYDTFYTDAEGVFKANPDFGWSETIRINSDGFRSGEFVYDSTSGQLRILFLGDSFTWGSSARPLTNSFVDLVARNGFRTYNTGIPGTGPTQYASLAEKHVPQLKPDFVAVMLYMGNDLKARPRPMLPHKNLFHDTNAKMFYAFDKNGKHMTPQEAYDYYIGKSNAAVTDRAPKGVIREIVMRSIVGTRAWVALSKLKRRLLSGGSSTEARKRKHAFTKRALARIKTVSERHGAKFMLFLLPVHPGKVSIYTSIENNLSVVEEFNPYIPDFLTRDDYRTLPNAHFNNNGHRKYAEFIVRCIDRELTW